MLTNAQTTPTIAMLMHIAMTPRDRFSAPVIEDIAEMEHTVLVNVKQLFQFIL